MLNFCYVENLLSGYFSDGLSKLRHDIQYLLLELHSA